MISKIGLAGIFSVALLLGAGCGDMDNDDDDGVAPGGTPSQSADSDPTPNDAGTLNNPGDPGAPADGGAGLGTQNRDPNGGQTPNGQTPNGQTPNGQVPTPEQSPDVEPQREQ